MEIVSHVCEQIGTYSCSLISHVSVDDIFTQHPGYSPRVVLCRPITPCGAVPTYHPVWCCANPSPRVVLCRPNPLTTHAAGSYRDATLF